MSALINKEDIKLIDNDVLDLNDFNSIEISGRNPNEEDNQVKNKIFK